MADHATAPAALNVTSFHRAASHIHAGISTRRAAGAFSNVHCSATNPGHRRRPWTSTFLPHHGCQG